MDTSELKQYLKDVYDLESRRYAIEKIATTYDNEKRNRLELKGKCSAEAIFKMSSSSKVTESGELIPYKNFYEYESYLKQKAESKKVDSARYKTSRVIAKISHVLMIIGIIITVLAMISLFKSDGLVGTIFLGGFIAMIILGVFWGGAYLIHGASESMNEKSYDEVYLNVILEEVGTAEKFNEKICNKLANEYKSIIIPAYNEANKLLDHIYASNIIHPKYRSFLAVAQIYEYIDTGRCTELEGTNGAYNLFESELRQNMIIDRLDIIIEQLEELNRTMRYVASSINQTNRLLSEISSSLGRLEANTALIQYNTQVSAHYAQIANRYGY